MSQQRTDPTSLISLPNSLQQQLDRASNLLAQSEHAQYYGDHSLATVKAQEALQVVQAIARTAPELAGLIILAEMGYSGFEYETIEREDNYQVVERNFLGINFGSQVVNVPTYKYRSVRGRIY